MFTITGRKNGVIWDGEKDRPLAIFKNGIFTTEDQAVAEKLKAMGLEVKGEFKAPDPLAAMSVKELTAYAAEKEIDLGGATKKADILAAIKAAEFKAPDPEE